MNQELRSHRSHQSSQINRDSLCLLILPYRQDNQWCRSTLGWQGHYRFSESCHRDQKVQQLVLVSAKPSQQQWSHHHHTNNSWRLKLPRRSQRQKQTDSRSAKARQSQHLVAASKGAQQVAVLVWHVLTQMKPKMVKSAYIAMTRFLMKAGYSARYATSGHTTAVQEWSHSVRRLCARCAMTMTRTVGLSECDEVHRPSM